VDTKDRKSFDDLEKNLISPVLAAYDMHEQLEGVLRPKTT